MDTKEAAARLREEAAERDRRAAESFERSDTDGFLSQWASGITARKLRKEAEILENGGLGRKVGLFDADGNRIKAKQVETQWGTKWMLLDENDVAVEWVPPQFPDRPLSPRTKMAKLGLHEEWEMVPVAAEYGGSGTGLSGAASVHVYTRRLDNGYPEGAKPWKA